MLKYGHLMNSETNWLHGPQTIVTLAWSFISRTIPLAGRWTIKLQDYPIRIIQKQVVENGLADFMSRVQGQVAVHTLKEYMANPDNAKFEARRSNSVYLLARRHVLKMMIEHMVIHSDHESCKCTWTMAATTLHAALKQRWRWGWDVVFVCVCVWSFGHLVIWSFISLGLWVLGAGNPPGILSSQQGLDITPHWIFENLTLEGLAVQDVLLQRYPFLTASIRPRSLRFLQISKEQLPDGHSRACLVQGQCQELGLDFSNYVYALESLRYSKLQQSILLAAFK